MFFKDLVIILVHTRKKAKLFKKKKCLGGNVMKLI